MKERTHIRGNPKKARDSLLLVSILSVSVSFTAVTIQPALSGERQQTCAEKSQVSGNMAAAQGRGGKTVDAPKGAVGMKVYRDPVTGEFGPPPAGEVPEALGEAFSTSSEGLLETPSPTPGGGTMVDLKGRFRSPLTATIGPEGKLSIEHRRSLPGANAKEE